MGQLRNAEYSPALKLNLQPDDVVAALSLTGEFAGHKGQNFRLAWAHVTPPSNS